MRILATSSILFTLLAQGAGAADSGETKRPVLVGGEADLDACGSVGEPMGLRSDGDNFLAVRAAPSSSAPIVFRLKSGQSFYMCDASGDARWTGIVFDPGPESERDCGVASPQAVRDAYAGPCFSGWVSTRYVRLVAG